MEVFPMSADSSNEAGPRYDETRATLRVTYAEVDKMGVVYYGNYLRWFEVGRAEYLRARGKTYRQIEEEGLALPVVEAYARYRQSAVYDDLIEIATAPLSMDRARVKFGYRVFRQADGALLTEGYTIHACQGPKHRVIRFPAEVLELLARAPL
jgi:acyl-CoA thioester hydrolase